MMNNILILDFPFAREVKESNVEFAKYYKDPNYLQRVLAVLRFPQSHTVNQEWVSKVSKSDIIILFDTLKNYNIETEHIEQICKHNARLIFYAWNPIAYSKAFNAVSDRWEKFSFSKNDAAKYSIKYKNTFYFHDFISPKENNFECDGVFVGLDKGRTDIINRISGIYSSNGLKSIVHIVDNFRSKFSKKYSPYMSYTAMCNLIIKSRSIIEVVQEGQEGMSLRVMESLFYQKKLVTNNKNITQYDFYQPENIFIIDYDNENQFKSFIESPYHVLPSEIIDKYRFTNWLNSF